MLSTEERQQIRQQLDMSSRFITTLSSFEGKEWPRLTLFEAVERLLADVEELHAQDKRKQEAGQFQLDDLAKQVQDDGRRIDELMRQREKLVKQRDEAIAERDEYYRDRVAAEDKLLHVTHDLEQVRKACDCRETTQTKQAGLIDRLNESLADLTAQRDAERKGRIVAEEKLQLTLRKLSTPQARRLAILQHCDEVEERLREMTAENTQMGVALAKANKKKWRASKKIQELQSKIDELHITLHEERDKTRDAVADAARLRDLLDKELKKPKPASNYELTRQLIMAQNEKQQLSQELDIGQRAKVGLEMSYDILHETALELREFASRALNLNLAYHDKRVELAELLEATKWLLRAEDNRPSS